MADNSTPDNKPCQVGNAKTSLTGILQSSLSPKYLHTNSTSHTWPFSAIAELIDNAYDPDVKASQLWIDKLHIRGKTCLSFTDNGFGMTATKLHKMLSFGFCEKVPEKGYMPVGHYGNGFKSGSMRLGKDALVLTKQETSRSVGFLSQTYLQETGAEMVVVPLATWDKKDDHFVLKPEGAKALDDIMIFSLLRSEKDLDDQFDKIPGNQGTRIVISNIRKNADLKSEFDFTTDENDIRIPDDANTDGGKYRQTKRQNHIPECDYSLKAYCAILYLKPRMQIMLRGKKVKTLNVEKSLSQTEVDRYKPTFLGEPVKVVFGFNSLNKNHYGIMMYHRNRLIKPYERVGYQLKPNNLGVGVVGVVQCDFLQPTHNKQDFDYTKQYRTCMNALGIKLNEYWNEKKGVGSKSNNASGALNQPIPEIQAAPDQNWVQCDEPTCLKWRKLPDSFNTKDLPDKWYCRMNPNENYKSCDIPEERDDEDNSNIVPYAKVQKRRLEREMQEKHKRAKIATERFLLEQQQKSKLLEQKEAALKAKEQALNKQLAEIDVKPKIKIEQSSPNKIPTAQVSPRTTKVPKPLKEVLPTMANKSIPKSKVSPVKQVTIQPSPGSKSRIEPKPTQTIVIKKSPGRLPVSTTTTQQLPQLSQNVPAMLTKTTPILLTSGTNRLIIPAAGVTPVSSSTPQTVRFVTKGGDTRLEAGGISIKVVKSSDGRSVLLQDGNKTISPGISQLNTSTAKLLQNIGVTPSVIDNAALTTLAAKTPVTNNNVADVKPLLSVVLPKPQTRVTSSTTTTPTENRYVTIAPNTQTAKAYPQIIKAVSKAAESYPEIFDAVVSNKPTEKNKTTVTGIKRESDSQVNGGSPTKSTKLNTVIIVDPKVDQSLNLNKDAVQTSKLASSTKFAVMEQKYKEKLSNLEKEVGVQTKDNVRLKITLENKKKALLEVRKELRLKENVLDDNKKHLEKVSQQLQDKQNAVEEKEKQLKNLRANVCRLLQVLVPEIDVDCEEGKGEGETVDELLKQVLEANK